MAVTDLDHLYIETHDWEASVSFWEGLGFSFASRWGSSGHRAGRLESAAAAVVLAEVSADQSPGFNAFFRLDEADDFAMGPGVEVTTPLEDTHWGTRWIRVRDPEGQVYSLEAEGSA